MGRPNQALLIGEADRLQLRALVRSRSMPHSLVRRARIVLLSGEGQSNREVARTISPAVKTFLPKPYNAETLLRVVASIVGADKAAA